MSELLPVLSETAIQEKVSILAQRISEDYRDRNLVLIGVLKGAFVFLSDLMRKLSIPVTIDFVKVSSYHSGIDSSGEIELVTDISVNIRDKDVLIVEDILDTGLTLSTLLSHFSASDPRSIKICTFIDKCERRQTDCRADYSCHSVESGFLVGYGLDYAEKYRHLPAVYELINSSNGEAK